MTGFYQDVAKWRDQTLFVSSIHEMLENPAMKRIIARGKPIIPLILNELQTQPDFLFLALHKITGENPIPKEHAGYVDKMIAAWIEWGTHQKNSS